MKTNLFTRFALLCALVLALCVPALAQAPSAAPVLTFNLADGATVLRSADVVQVGVQAAYAPGLRCVSLSGGYSGGTSYFPSNPATASCATGFYVSSFAPGPYIFRAVAVGTDGHYTLKSITLNVK